MGRKVVQKLHTRIRICSSKVEILEDFFIRRKKGRPNHRAADVYDADLQN